MNRIALALLLVILVAPFADARARRSSSGHHATTSHSVRVPKIKVPSTRHRAARCTTCTRDSKGRIARRRTATRDFQKAHPCPKLAAPARARVRDRSCGPAEARRRGFVGQYAMADEGGEGEG